MSRCEKVNYRALDNYSTASELEVLDYHKRKRTKDVYQAEEILAEKKVSNQILLL